MSRERVKIMAPTSRGRLRALPLAEVIAPNLALHLRLGSRSHLHRKPASEFNQWIVTQISSGLRVGWFPSIEAAEFFALRAIEIAPALVSGEPLTEERARVLVELMGHCGGRRP